jgi:hypothetical protein
MVKSFLKTIVICLLIFNSIGAIWGSFNMLSAPDGSTMDWSPIMLRYSPFNDFFFPGLILLISNGLFSMGVVGMIAVRYRRYPWFIMLQGVILTGWILVQVLMLRFFSFLHFIMGLIGVTLIILGWVLKDMHAAKMKALKKSFPVS